MDDRTVPIPQPPTVPFLGNIFNIDMNGPILSYIRLSEKYGPIFKLRLINRDIVVISDYALVNEACDESRFQKTIVGILTHLRDITGSGLGTCYTYDPLWIKAHNILTSCFNKQAMQRYFEGMEMTTGRLIEKWRSTQGKETIDVSEDMTSLALDTIGICGFNYDFNLFYREGAHPFVEAFSSAFKTTMQRIAEPSFLRPLRFYRERKFQKNIRYLHETVDTIIHSRRQAGPGQTKRTDMLSYMLWGVDEKTGERLSDINIRDQVITFITIGQDTVAGLMAFTLQALVKHPDVLAKAYTEIDTVTKNTTTITYEHLQQLPYLKQILQEVLRLWPVVPAFMLEPFITTLLAEKYPVHPYNQIVVLLPKLHRDPTIWGPDAEAFNPDNFLPEAIAKRPANAYKPFGNGVRACIAREFAMQEALLAITTILKNFTLIDPEPHSLLAIKEINLFKPDNFKIKVQVR